MNLIKRIFSVILIMMILLSSVSFTAFADDTVCVYVSTTGDDSADGSVNNPLKTIDAARLKVRELKETTDKPITVYLRGGDYYLDESVRFDEHDSGTENAPITYTAYQGENVNIYGCKNVPSSKVSKVTDKEILDRVIDSDASDKLMVIDFSDVVDEIPKFYTFENNSEKSQLQFEVYTGETALTAARWPNSDSDFPYTMCGAISSSGVGKKVNAGSDAIERMKLWSDKAGDNLFVRAFFSYEYNNDVYMAHSLDRTGGTFEISGNILNSGDWYAISGNKRYYFFNVLEEIDKPGECYFDYDNLLVYFYPTEDFDAKQIRIPMLTESMFIFRDTSDIVIDNLNFLFTRRNAVDIRSNTTNYYDLSDLHKRNLTVKNCTIAHTSWNAGTFYGTDITVKDCLVYDTANGGFSFVGGDRATMTSGNSIIENCEIANYNRNERTYWGAISANSLGLIIRNNKLHGGVHEAIAISTNDVVVEYNEIYDSVTEAFDMGAIYFGRNPSLMGTVIRYNYFHDIGSQYKSCEIYSDSGQQSIYIDDGNMGAEIYGNVFVNACGTYSSETGAIKTHGSQYSQIYNNIFVDTEYAYIGASWGGGTDNGQDLWMRWLYDKAPEKRHAIVEKLNTFNFDSDVWHEHYRDTVWNNLYKYITNEMIADVAGMSSSDFNLFVYYTAPRYTNEIRGNVMVNAGVAQHKWGTNNTDENNYLTDDKSIFVSGSDYSLSDGGLEEVRGVITDFENIPFGSIGLVSERKKPVINRTEPVDDQETSEATDTTGEDIGKSSGISDKEKYIIIIGSAALVIMCAVMIIVGSKKSKDKK